LHPNHMIYSVHYDKGCEHDGHFPNIALQFQAQIGWDYSCKKHQKCTDEIEPTFNSQFYWIVVYIACYNISSIDPKPEIQSWECFLAISIVYKAQHS
jgi:hypothetical protein